jgi:hypothetical protein
MIGATYSVLARFAGSAQSLTRSLSPFHRIAIATSPAARRCPLFSRRKPPLHPTACQFFQRSHRRKLRKHIQYPGTRSGSVQ